MSNRLERYLIQKASLNEMPIQVTLELTPLCNLNCKMCYIHRSFDEVLKEGGIKPVSYWENLIPQMKDLGVLFVTLIGGEPFLYPKLGSLYKKLYRNGFYINITTNAIPLAKEIPKWLKDNPPRYVTVSIYGGSDETYQILTGDSNGFTKTMKGLENLLQAGIPVKLNYVVVSENKKDFYKIFDIKEKYNLPILATAYCFPMARRVKKNEYNRLSPQECAFLELKIKELVMKDKYKQWKEYLNEKDFSNQTTMHTEHIYCQGGKCTFWMTWQGDMLPCGMMQKLRINNVHNNLKESWDLLKRMVSDAQISYKCSKCDKREICQVCPAMMEAETGDLRGCPEYVCHITENMIRLASEE